MKECSMSIRGILIAVFLFIVCTEYSFAESINLKKILGNTSENYVLENVQYNNKGNIILAGYYSEVATSGQCVFVAEFGQDFTCLNIQKHCFPNTFVKIYKTIVAGDDRIYLSVFKNEVKNGSKKIGLLTMNEKYEEITANSNNISYLYDKRSGKIQEIFLNMENGNLYYNLCDRNKSSICSNGEKIDYHFEKETGIADMFFYDQKLFLLLINIASQKYSSVILDLKTQEIKMVKREIDYAKLINDGGDIVLVSFYNGKEKTEVEHCFINNENLVKRKLIIIDEKPQDVSNVTLRENISCITSDINPGKLNCYDLQNGTKIPVLFDKDQDDAIRILISQKENKIFIFRQLFSEKEKRVGKIIIEKKDVVPCQNSIHQ